MNTAALPTPLKLEIINTFTETSLFFPGMGEGLM
jgi:hypothetical protein